MRIVFEIAGEKQIERELLRVGEYAGDASPAFEKVVDLWMSETQLQFDSEGGHASGGWKPLKESTLREKEHRLARGEIVDLRILHATHALEHSLTRRGDSNQLLEIKPDEITWGSKLPYAGAHQHPRPGSRLPQRRPVELTERARRESVKIVQRFILTGTLE